jgi:hypothetical protein
MFAGIDNGRCRWFAPMNSPFDDAVQRAESILHPGQEQVPKEQIFAHTQPRQLVDNLPRW